MNRIDVENPHRTYTSFFSCDIRNLPILTVLVSQTVGTFANLYFLYENYQACRLKDRKISSNPLLNLGLDITLLALAYMAKRTGVFPRNIGKNFLHQSIGNSLIGLSTALVSTVGCESPF